MPPDARNDFFSAVPRDVQPSTPNDNSFADAIASRYGQPKPLVTARLSTTEDMPPPSPVKPPIVHTVPPPLVHSNSFSALSPTSLPSITTDPTTLILDIRPHVAYTAARIHSAISLSVPSTLLKRPMFSLARLTDMLPSRDARRKFKRWPEAATVVVYDADSLAVREGSNLLGLMRKFVAEGMSPENVFWVRGGFQAVWKEQRSLIDQDPLPDEQEEDADDDDNLQDTSILRTRNLPMSAFTLSSTTSSRPTLDTQTTPPQKLKRDISPPMSHPFALSRPRSTKSTTPLPPTQAYNPFFDTIRQNVELSHGITERIPLVLPSHVRRRIRKGGLGGFRWLEAIAWKACGSSSGSSDEKESKSTEEGSEMTRYRDSRESSRGMETDEDSEENQSQSQEDSDESDRPTRPSLASRLHHTRHLPRPSAADVDEGTEELAVQFYRIELAEQRRMMGVMEHHSREGESPSGASSPVSPSSPAPSFFSAKAIVKPPSFEEKSKGFEFMGEKEIIKRYQEGRKRSTSITASAGGSASSRSTALSSSSATGYGFGGLTGSGSAFTSGSGSSAAGSANTSTSALGFGNLGFGSSSIGSGSGCTPPTSLEGSTRGSRENSEVPVALSALGNINVVTTSSPLSMLDEDREIRERRSRSRSVPESESVSGSSGSQSGGASVYGDVAMLSPTSPVVSGFGRPVYARSNSSKDGKETKEGAAGDKEKERKRKEKALKKQQAFPYSITAGVEKGAKNRYRNIWPFEHARVKLLSKSGKTAPVVSIVTPKFSASVSLNALVAGVLVPSGSLTAADAGAAMEPIEEDSEQTEGLDVIKAANGSKADPDSPKSSDSPYDDYVNASYVQPLGTKKRYIATQGPLEATFVDFWTLCWEQNVHVIVMLTREVEGMMEKCGKYWKEGDFGPLKLKLLESSGTPENEDVVNKFDFFGAAVREAEAKTKKEKRAAAGFFPPALPTEAKEKDTSKGHAKSGGDGHGKKKKTTTVRRVFELSHSRYPEAGSRVVTHLQYLGWPDMNVPDDPAGVLDLIKQMDKEVEMGQERERVKALDRARASHVQSEVGVAQSSSSHESSLEKNKLDSRTGIVKHALDSPDPPILLHCSAGVGRTGGFIVVDAVLDGLKRELKSKREGTHSQKVEEDKTVWGKTPIGQRINLDEGTRVKFSSGQVGRKFAQPDTKQGVAQRLTEPITVATPYAGEGSNHISGDVSSARTGMARVAPMEVDRSPPRTLASAHFGPSVSNISSTPGFNVSSGSVLSSPSSPWNASSSMSPSSYPSMSPTPSAVSSSMSPPFSSASSMSPPPMSLSEAAVGHLPPMASAVERTRLKAYHSGTPLVFGGPLEGDLRTRTVSEPSPPPFEVSARPSAQQSHSSYEPRQPRGVTSPKGRGAVAGTQSSSLYSPSPSSSQSSWFTSQGIRTQRGEGTPISSSLLLEADTNMGSPRVSPDTSNEPSPSEPAQSNQQSFNSKSVTDGGKARETLVSKEGAPSFCKSMTFDYIQPRKLHQTDSPPLLSSFQDPIRTVVEDMREQRMSLCQSLRQYVFVHRAIIEGALRLLDESKELSALDGRGRDTGHHHSSGSGNSAGTVHPSLMSSPTKHKRLASPTELVKEGKEGHIRLAKRPSMKRQQLSSDESARFETD